MPAETNITGVTQIGIITADIDRAVRTWADRYGVGPWQVFRFDPSNMSELTVGGRPVEYGMRIALAYLGPMMFELIEPSDERSVYAQSLERHGGADHFHHILCDTDDFHATLAAFAQKGITPAQTGHMHETHASFAYLDSEPDIGFMLEFAHVDGELNLPEPMYVYPPPGE